jgi:DNA-directed RNA polymerase specialized sigma24 family protein
MAAGSDGSISRWLVDLKAGDLAAAQPLWERYFDQLVRLARSRLRASRRRSGDADEEDAALSAFDSFCEGAVRGQFPRLDDREDLWRLLFVITARKVAAQSERQSRQKRGGGRVIQDDGRDADDLLDQIVGREPSPELAAMFAEEYHLRLDALGDDALRQVAIWRMEGRNTDEIADGLGCARRTVARRLDLIRRIWSEDGGDATAENGELGGSRILGT